MAQEADKHQITCTCDICATLNEPIVRWWHV